MATAPWAGPVLTHGRGSALGKGCGEEQEPATLTGRSARCVHSSQRLPESRVLLLNAVSVKGSGRNGGGPFSKLNFLNFPSIGTCVDNGINLSGSQISSFKGIIVYICVNSRNQWCQRGNAEAPLGHQVNE